jgi:hypothetical protein
MTAVADGNGVSRRAGLEGRGGIKLHAVKRISTNKKEKVRITTTLLNLGTARFYCTLTMGREWNISFLIHDKPGKKPAFNGFSGK